MKISAPSDFLYADTLFPIELQHVGLACEEDPFFEEFSAFFNY